MPDTVHVSVVILSYNQKSFLIEAIESVLLQEVKELEIVVADDHSTDGTHLVLKEYQRRFPDKFKILIAKENQGIGPNTNAAFHACSGKYIAWLGGDDVMLPQKLKLQLEFMEANPNCVLSYHDVDVFESISNETIRFFNSGKLGLKPVEGGAAELIEHGTVNCGCATMVKRSACPEYGFDPKILIASDWLHWIETARNGEVRYIDKVLSRYRRHSGNVTAKPRSGDHEFLLTLGILEARYPDYLPVIRKRRAALFYTQAIWFYRNNEMSYARMWAWEACRLRPWHPKTWMVLGLSTLSWK